MSLLQDVLRPPTDTLEKRLANISLNRHANSHAEDSEDEWINVVSPTGTPTRSNAPTRPSSPTPDGFPLRSTPARSPLHATSPQSGDPLKALPTELSQRIFHYLSIVDLAKCAIVSRKWNRSQTLNYVWFQRYRREYFHDGRLPTGKWSKRESKQNWRILYVQGNGRYSPPRSPAPPSGRASPLSSGYRTPRELREEQWRQEAEIVPDKVQMRLMYKELGGRKSQRKSKVGSTGGPRDKGAWEETWPE